MGSKLRRYLPSVGKRVGSSYEVPASRISEVLRCAYQFGEDLNGLDQLDSYVHAWFMAEKGSWEVYSAPKLKTPVKSDPYATLFLTTDAPYGIVQAVWKYLARKLHPDVGGSPEAFMKIKAAYDEISNQESNKGCGSKGSS